MARLVPAALFLALFCTPGWAHAAAVEALDPDALDELLTTLGDDLATEPTTSETWAMKAALWRGFAHTPVLARTVRERMDPLAEMRDPTWLRTMEHAAIVARLRGVRTHQAREVEALAFDIPLADHALVDTYIDHFTGRGRWFFAKWLARSERYVPIMQRILAEAGLPRDIVYLAMIESGFSAKAVSSSRAVGFWQFMAMTADRFRLKRNKWVDDRRDFIAATHAAAKYLRILHNEFHDWHLAFAAYNAGEGRVRRALAKSGAKDYWSLIEHHSLLSEETRHYVPKILAAAIVAKNRARYGFGTGGTAEPVAWEDVQLAAPVDLRVLAQHLGVSYQALHELNPSLLTPVTPPRQRQLRVPPTHAQRALAWLRGTPKEQHVQYRHYTVAAGDTLYKIARRFRTTIELLRDVNHITDPRALAPGQPLLIPDAERARPAARKARVTLAQVAQRKHVVDAGETFWSISQRYGLSVDALKSANQKRSNNLRTGEVLQIP